MTTNSQLSATEQKQTTRTGRESHNWRSHGGSSVGSGRKDNGGKGTGNKNEKR